jgi:hypothetical protein
MLAGRGLRGRQQRLDDRPQLVRHEVVNEGRHGREPATPSRQELNAVPTTEHFVLQAARSAISEQIGRGDEQARGESGLGDGPDVLLNGADEGSGPSRSMNGKVKHGKRSPSGTRPAERVPNSERSPSGTQAPEAAPNSHLTSVFAGQSLAGGRDRV